MLLIANRTNLQFQTAWSMSVNYQSTNSQHNQYQLGNYRQLDSKYRLTGRQFRTKCDYLPRNIRKNTQETTLRQPSLTQRLFTSRQNQRSQLARLKVPKNLTQPNDCSPLGSPQLIDNYFKPLDSSNSLTTRTISRPSKKIQTSVQLKPSNMYYPPSCSGCDIVYCRAEDAIYVYGGIPCSSRLDVDGIHPYFYRLKDNNWQQMKIGSTYNPSPRYGHTLTVHQRELILFGGVSQYKQKLKDRCFYTDISVYSTVRNTWKMMESCGRFVKTRKNHAACCYGKYYIVHGGLDEEEKVVNEINWINLEGKKQRWKHLVVEGRFNHKMIVVERGGKQLLLVFGGRNKDLDIVNTLFVGCIGTNDCNLELGEFVMINNSISPRQMPIVCEVEHGLAIFGGIDSDNNVAQDSWYYNSQKQCLQQMEIQIDYKQLRGARGTSLHEQIYLFVSNSMKYKAISICLKCK